MHALNFTIQLCLFTVHMISTAANQSTV